MKRYLFDETLRLSAKDFLFYPANLSMHINNSGVSVPGFYALTISKYGLVVNETSRDYLFTGNMTKDPTLLNFTFKDCELPMQDFYFNSLTTNFTLTGKGFYHTVYTAFDKNLQTRQIDMFTREIFAEMYISDSTLVECNFYIDSLGPKPTEGIKIYVDSFNDTSIKFKGVKVPPKCQRGNLYINITFHRVIYGVDSQVKLSKYVSYEKIKVGTFNCNISCLECRDDSQGCLSCHPGEVNSR